MFFLFKNRFKLLFDILPFLFSSFQFLHAFFKLLQCFILKPGAGYSHDRIDNNADSHLKAVLLGASEALPVSAGKLELGTWQRIFFAEMDGPRSRTVNVTLLKA
ncbi:secondary thiamine-phosphate synthase enzyme YjbQ [Methanosarcina barkeri]|uniref:secondary thiamine-phosphate synthase enzyme YjbQ n=1 Tax=Methanosarcina barkeri TaxID=2208 RepID=UPI0022A8BB45|nr:secondary thiamine-phosphate synthase enzyme YjbQ [Methanosarcina barkeri]